MIWVKTISVVSLLFAASAVAGGTAPVLNGDFALQGQQAQTEGHLRVEPVAGKPLSERLDLWMTHPGKPDAIRRYQVEMTKKLHMVIVSSDFKTFLHEHPVLGPDGHLRITEQFPAAGRYLVYADGLPDQLNHQVFRFQVDVGGTQQGNRILAPTGLGVQVGPYEVDLSSVRLHAGVMSTLDVTILKNGQPAMDLHPYLGVPAHAVFLNGQDLSYVHVHPMAMGQSMDMSMEQPPMPEGGPSPSAMMLHLALREAGTYRLWLQFHGGTQLYVAAFTITAS